MFSSCHFYSVKWTLTNAHSKAVRIHRDFYFWRCFNCNKKIVKLLMSAEPVIVWNSFLSMQHWGIMRYSMMVWKNTIGNDGLGKYFENTTISLISLRKVLEAKIIWLRWLWHAHVSLFPLKVLSNCSYSWWCKSFSMISHLELWAKFSPVQLGEIVSVLMSTAWFMLNFYGFFGGI